MTPTTPTRQSATRAVENGVPTKQILANSSPILQPISSLRTNGNSNQGASRSGAAGQAGGAGIFAGVSRLLRGGESDASPAALVTAEVGFGTPGTSGANASDFYASDLMPLNRPAGSSKDSRKAEIQEQDQLRQALFHRTANGIDMARGSASAQEAASARSHDRSGASGDGDKGAGGRLSSVVASMKSSGGGWMPLSRRDVEGHPDEFQNARPQAPGAASNPGWRSLSMNVSTPPL